MWTQLGSGIWCTCRTLGYADDKFAMQAVFVANVSNLDLSSLQPFLDRNWAVRGEKVPPEALQKLQRMIYIRLVYTVHSSSPPQITLHMPEHLAALLGMTVTLQHP